MSILSREKHLHRTILVCGVVSLAALLSVQVFSPRRTLTWSVEMLGAARRMEEAIQVIQAGRSDLISEHDLNATGLIGPEYGDLFTSLGDIEAKRTTTSPDMAALLVHLLESAGVERGDWVAVGCSASFPALYVAIMSATEVLGVHPVVIISFGSSSWGATDSRSTILDIHERLLDHGVITSHPAAISLGGTDDTGREFEPDVRGALMERIESSGIPFIREPDLRRNVAARMLMYAGEGREEACAAFVNVGGAYANMGTSPLVLDLEPGLNRELELPDQEKWGVLFEMAASGIPVLHLLHIRGLALRFGLPWDPVPLPEAGSAQFHDTEAGNGPLFLPIACLYLLSLAVTIFFGMIKPSQLVEE
ncbi:poly-gamma-glutamate system protein [Gemmatimonadota bacterium]